MCTKYPVFRRIDAARTKMSERSAVFSCRATSLRLRLRFENQSARYTRRKQDHTTRRKQDQRTLDLAAGHSLGGSKQSTDGVPVAEISQRAGSSQATYLSWTVGATICCRREMEAGGCSLRTRTGISGTGGDLC